MRVAVIADVHGNSPALRAVLDDIRECGIEQLVFLGDVINGPDPRGSLELLLGWPGAHCIKGNAEQYLCTEKLEEFPWREQPGWRWLVPALSDWRAEIGPTLLAQIAAWPDEMVYRDAWMVHDSPLDLMEAGTGPAELPQRYRLLVRHGKGLTPSSPPDAIAANADLTLRKGCRWLFCGHTHAAFVADAGAVTICNVGSAGMPLDRDPRAAWVSWESPIAEVRRVTYAIDETLELVARHLRDPQRRERYAEMFRNAVHWRQSG